jgi:hypothetical protein
VSRKQPNKETVLVIPDIQIPFEHPDTIPFLKAVRDMYEPTRVVQIGDLIDSHALSFYGSDPDGYSAGRELKKAIRNLKKFYRAFPKVDVVLGNHDDRLYRSAFAAGLPRSCIRDLPEILEFPKGWALHEDIVIDNVVYEHGDKFGNGNGNNAFKKAIDSNMASTVYGHFHAAAGVRWFANKRYLLFGFNVGCLMDGHSYAAAYGKKFANKPILGCGIVDEGIPQFIPMLLNRKSRWMGVI